MCVIEKVKVKPKPGLLENRTHSLRWLPNINSRSFKPQRKRILNLWTSLEGDSLQCMIEKAFNFEFFFPHDIYLRSLFSCVQLTEENRFIFRTTHASPVDPNLTFLCFKSILNEMVVIQRSLWILFFSHGILHSQFRFAEGIFAFFLPPFFPFNFYLSIFRKKVLPKR